METDTIRQKIKPLPANGAAGREVGRKRPVENGNPSNTTVPQVTPKVKDLLECKSYREQAGDTARAVAAIIRENFPKFTPQLLTACENPDAYGVLIHPDGLAAICQHYGIALKRRKKEGKRKLDRKITFRVMAHEYERIQSAAERDGFLSVQAWLYYTVKAALGEVIESA